MNANDRPAIPAATLILFHETDGQPAQHLMIERAARLAFAAGAVVFPGGRIDAGDHALAQNRATVIGGGDMEERAARIAAIRETIEETGAAIGCDPVPADGVIAGWRRCLKDGSSFEQLLIEDRVMLNLDALVPFARWCPNLGDHRRFDTRFYLARATHRANIVTDADETARYHWITATEAIAAATTGTLKIIFPTLRNLERLALFDSYEGAVRHARSTPLQIIAPEIRDEDGDRWLCIPQNAGYPVTRARLSEVRVP